MDVIRIREPGSVRPLHVVMIALVIATLAATSLLLSAEDRGPVDGAVEWHAESMLRAVVQLLCLNFNFPTINAGAVKVYALGIGAGLAALALGVAVFVGERGGEDGPRRNGESPTSPATPRERRRWRVSVTPLGAGQVLLALYVLWSFASGRWSAAPQLAVGGSILLGIHVLWTFGVAWGLSPFAARVACRGLVVIAGVTAAVAVWYYYGRNPTLRAKFPFGNPTFLSAALIPGILLSLAMVCEKIITALGARRWRPVLAALAALVVVELSVRAFLLTESRGPAVGLAAGVLAMFFFRVERAWKLVPVVLGLAIAIAGAIYVVEAKDRPSITGRDATLRVRFYAWDYAWRMFREKPVTGHGQGGFVLSGDSYAAADVAADPEPFSSRITHAHSEWLEVLADLGLIGLALIGGALLSTLRAGMLALNAPRPPGEHWALMALLGALVALVVEEAGGVGLRVSGVGAMFYTVVGLIWALSDPRQGHVLARVSASPWRRTLAAVAAGTLALSALTLSRQDFAAARAAFQVETSLADGKYDEAVEFAESAQSRLNPQRALANLFRRAQTHLRVAQRLLASAEDRQARASATPRVNDPLMVAARNDFQSSFDHCGVGVAALKELVSYSAGYLNHGRLEYMLNLAMARNPASGEGRDAYLGAASAAIRRELRRQPYNPSVAVDAVRIADDRVALGDLMDVLARPLRYERITPDYVDLLSRLAATPDFDIEFAPVIEQARTAAMSAHRSDVADADSRTWAPEKLRLAATIAFMRGEYGSAREMLTLACGAYEAMDASVPLAAASCYAELADCQFFDNPRQAEPAIASAERSLALAPSSLPGRRLRRAAEHRLVDYFLAADREADALATLRVTGPVGASEAAIRVELGLRYRKVCESVLARREAQLLRKPPRELLPNLLRWIRRSMALRPDDPVTEYVAADLAFQVDDEKTTAQHLRRALEFGLDPEVVLRFLQVALDEKPDSPSLRALLSAMQPATISGPE